MKVIAKTQSRARATWAAAEQAHREGNFAKAIRLQKETIGQLKRESASTFQARKLLSLYLFSAGRYQEALNILSILREEAPDDLELMENSGVLLRLLGRQQEAVEFLRVVHARDPKRVNVCDALAHCYANLGDKKNSIRFGSRSLELKDEEAAGREPICEVPQARPPDIDWSGGLKNVIAFSLWGDGDRYLKGAIRNAQIAADIYPGWVVRFYCDESVPSAVRKRLQEYQCEVIMKPAPATFFDGLLWRFEVTCDPGVGRFLIRDCDSVLNVQERVAVDEWLQSDRWFHVMRDFASHTEVILAGMWGGVSGVLPPVDKIRSQFKPNSAPTRTFDQILLRECVWPVVRQSALIHDSVYTGTLGSVDFPEVGQLPARFHVGQNEAAVRPDIFVDVPSKGQERGRGTCFVFSLDEVALDLAKCLLSDRGGIYRTDVTLGGMEEAARRFRDGFLKEENEEYVREVVATSLHALASEAPDADSDCLLVEAKLDDLEIMKQLVSEEASKLLCVVRNPISSLSSAEMTEPWEADEFVSEWVSSLRALSRVNREFPGHVEIVRYEDLALGSRTASLERICRFLNLAPGDPAGENFGEIETAGIVTDEVRSLVLSKAGKLMKSLRYED